MVLVSVLVALSEVELVKVKLELVRVRELEVSDSLEDVRVKVVVVDSEREDVVSDRELVVSDKLEEVRVAEDVVSLKLLVVSLSELVLSVSLELVSESDVVVSEVLVSLILELVIVAVSELLVSVQLVEVVSLSEVVEAVSEAEVVESTVVEDRLGGPTKAAVVKVVSRSVDVETDTAVVASIVEVRRSKLVVNLVGAVFVADLVELAAACGRAVVDSTPYGSPETGVTVATVVVVVRVGGTSGTATGAPSITANATNCMSGTSKSIRVMMSSEVAGMGLNRKLKDPSGPDVVPEIGLILPVLRPLAPSGTFHSRI